LQALFFAGLAALSATAQQPRALTAADYANAEKFMPYNTSPLVLHGAIHPNWISDTRFWYQTNTASGVQFILFDAARNAGQPAFDHARLAATLSKAAGTAIDPAHLNLTRLEFSADTASISFTAAAKRWTCDVQGTKCALTTEAPTRAIETLSPDKSRAAFIRNYNLWVRDTGTGSETQLTTDGVKDFGYATDNAGWTSSDRPILLWSPDSQKIATYQQDQRGVGEMYLVRTEVGHPELKTWKYPLPGDEHITTIQRVVVDVAARKVVRLQLPPDQHRSSLCDDVACRGTAWSDVEWSADAAHLAFVSTSRDHKREQLRVADAATGAVRDVLEESVPTFFESGNDAINWRYLAASNEFIWFSERSGWGHLYLYDLATGKLRNPITTGEWNVTSILRVDEKKRQVYFLGVGHEKGRDPYFVHLYRAGFDGANPTLLTPEDATHDISLSPAGDYFVDSYSSPVAPSIAVLRDPAGKLLSTVETSNIAKLVETGWKPPIPFTVKARDGQTDLSGLMYRPTHFDENAKYPIINHIYPGPQTGSIGSRDFRPSRGDTEALAELGFVVVEIDGMGTPWRSKKFHEAYFGDMGDNTLPDQVAGMKELAGRYPWIDPDRAGIYGHSGGGFATADAMFRYPDFFKVGISEAGNHDNREYEDDWAEKWIGLLEKKPDGTSNYDSQANQSIAKNLKGHLLLAHGTMDDNVPPYNTLLVVNELIKANKDFDLLMLPNRSHGFGNEPYMVRRRWDYFVRYLLGAEPPHEYQMHPAEP
jgi:dipeptidyl aminopeptidase/acylaminoacyl peptidase